MNMPMQWRRNPKPDTEVLALAEELEEAAQKGQVRCMCVVTVNPMLEVEFNCAGELDEVRRNLLIGALHRMIRRIDQ